jgi:hypothetical protein
MDIKLKRNHLLVILAFIAFSYVCIDIRGYFNCFVALSIFASTLIIYYGLRSTVGDPVTAILLLIVLALVTSWTPKEAQLLVTLGLLACSLVSIIINRLSIQEILKNDLQTVGGANLFNILFWTFFLLYTTLIGIVNSDGLWSSPDRTHLLTVPMYGRMFTSSFFSAPNLGYEGTSLSYNSLAERLPFYLSDLFNISVIESSYFVTPFLCVVLAMLLIGNLGKEYKVLAIPVAVLFFFPVESNSVISTITLFDKTLMSSSSYFLASLVTITAIVFLGRRNYFRLILSLVCLGLIKSVFFITVSGGVFFFLMRNKQMKLLAFVFGPIVVIAIALYALVVSGQLGVTHFFLFPHAIYVRMPSIFFSPTLDFDLNRWATFPLVLLLGISTLTIYRISKLDDMPLALGSVGLSGLIAIFLLTEPTGGNAGGFITPAYYAIVVAFWIWLKREPPNQSKWTTFFYSNILVFFVIWALCLMSNLLGGKIYDYLYLLHDNPTTTSLSFLIGLPAIAMLCHFSKWRPRQYIVIPLYLIVMVHLTQQVTRQKLIANSPVVQQWIGNRSIDGGSRGLRPSFTNDFLNASGWLAKHNTERGIVLYGKHYEDNPGHGTTERIALSGAQSYAGWSKYHGSILEDTFVERVSYVSHFYDKYVVSGPLSSSLLEKYVTDSLPIFEPTRFSKSFKIEKNDSLAAKYIYYASLGKEWSHLNLPDRRNLEISAAMSKLNEPVNNTKKWCSNFLANENITFIMLENKDNPTATLSQLTNIVYSNDTIKILKVRNNI